MSAFKRYRSKVFWGRMATQDLGSDRTLHEEDAFSQLSSPQFDLKDSESDYKESSGSCCGNDLSDDKNITAIRVCSNDEVCQRNLALCKTPVGLKDVPEARGSAESGRVKTEEDCIVRGNRSYSPSSQDLRSLDSGFSDSERSHCCGQYENETPRRRRRRKKLRDRKSKVYTKFDSFCLQEDGILSNPTFTSTPKEPKTFGGQHLLFAKANVCALDPQRIIGESSNKQAVESVSLDDESLGDFLYAAEPPEDVIEPIAAQFSTMNSPESSKCSRSVLNSRNYRRSSSVRSWLVHLAMDTENECSIALQSKNLPKQNVNKCLPMEDEMKDLKVLSSLATAAANKLLMRISEFEQHYHFVMQKLSNTEPRFAEKDLLRGIEDDAYSILSELGAPPPRRIQLGSLKRVLEQLETMKNYVQSIFDTRLDYYIEKIVRALEEAPKEDSSISRGVLAALTVLGLAGPRAGSSIARCSGIRSLLTPLITTNSTSSDFIAASLRALASVCSSSAAIEQFANDSGPEILVDLLASDVTSEKEKMEATALVVQITAPWTRAAGLPHLEPFAEMLIPALSRLVETSDCGQTLLLAAAALNQMSRSRKCASVILEHESVRKLLKSVKKSSGGNIWLMEQVASLVGELARIPEGRPHLARARASVALVCFLRMRPPGLEDAYRRLETTAAAALTRLCVDPEIARQVVSVGGADCLPSCNVDDLTEDKASAGLLRYTKSLRRACKKAAQQIDIAKAYDLSPLN